jgi:hypothetical protein
MSYFTAMVRAVITHFRPTVVFFAAASFVMSMFWCADADCADPNSDDECSSVVGSLFGRSGDHSAPAKAVAHEVNCICACHTPVVEPPTLDLLPVTLSSGFEPYQTLRAPAAPVRTLDQPPRA